MKRATQDWDRHEPPFDGKVARAAAEQGSASLAKATKKAMLAYAAKHGIYPYEAEYLLLNSDGARA